jgi:hypothetical protein
LLTDLVVRPMAGLPFLSGAMAFDDVVVEVDAGLALRLHETVSLLEWLRVALKIL